MCVPKSDFDTANQAGEVIKNLVTAMKEEQNARIVTVMYEKLVEIRVGTNAIEAIAKKLTQDSDLVHFTLFIFLGLNPQFEISGF